MNETIDLIRRHRSVRRYDDAPIPEAHVRAAVEAGQAASTSSAVQAYCLIRISDPARRHRLVELTGGQTKVERCGAFFAVCGDTRRHRLLCRRDGRPYDAGLEAFLLAVIDATLFAQNLALAFESMGYGLCYIGGLRNDLPAVQRLLEFPEGIYPLYGLCVGVPAERPSPRPRLGVDAVYFDDRYPDDDAMLDLIDAYDTRYAAYRRARDGRDDAGDQRWSTVMAEKFARPQRTALRGYYTDQGAEL